MSVKLNFLKPDPFNDLSIDGSSGFHRPNPPYLQCNPWWRRSRCLQRVRSPPPLLCPCNWDQRLHHLHPLPWWGAPANDRYSCDNKWWHDKGGGSLTDLDKSWQNKISKQPKNHDQFWPYLTYIWFHPKSSQRTCVTVEVLWKKWLLPHRTCAPVTLAIRLMSFLSTRRTPSTPASRETIESMLDVWWHMDFYWFLGIRTFTGKNTEIAHFFFSSEAFEAPLPQLIACGLRSIVVFPINWGCFFDFLCLIWMLFCCLGSQHFCFLFHPSVDACWFQVESFHIASWFISHKLLCETKLHLKHRGRPGESS